jgi:hypothetical protein
MPNFSGAADLDGEKNAPEGLIIKAQEAFVIDSHADDVPDLFELLKPHYRPFIKKHTLGLTITSWTITAGSMITTPGGQFLAQLGCMLYMTCKGAIIGSSLGQMIMIPETVPTAAEAQGAIQRCCDQLRAQKARQASAFNGQEPPS